MRVQLHIFTTTQIFANEQRIHRKHNKTNRLKGTNRQGSTFSAPIGQRGTPSQLQLFLEELPDFFHGRATTDEERERSRNQEATSAELRD